MHCLKKMRQVYSTGWLVIWYNSQILQLFLSCVKFKTKAIFFNKKIIPVYKIIHQRNIRRLTSNSVS